MASRIELQPHTGEQPIYDSQGVVMDTIEVDTGMQRIYLLRQDKETGDTTRQQIGFVHPNNFVHFIIPDPPKEFQDEVKTEVERLIQQPVRRMGGPPPIEAPADS